MAEQRDNSGALFKNDRKERDSHPDYKGSAMIDGIDHWVSAWIKRGQKGTTFMSLAFTPKQERQQRETASSQPVAPRRGSMKDALDDEIPFAPEWR